MNLKKNRIRTDDASLVVGIPPCATLRHLSLINNKQADESLFAPLWACFCEERAQIQYTAEKNNFIGTLGGRHHCVREAWIFSAVLS